MATPGEMVTAMAKALHVPENSLTLIDRRLQEVGMRKTGGRGRSAPVMGVADIANLLIAAHGFSVVREINEDVEAYAALAASHGCNGKEALGASKGMEPWCFDGISLPALEALPAQHSFGEAVKALITDAAYGDIEKARQAGAGIRVSMQSPRKRAAIEVQTGNTRSYRFYVAPPKDGIANKDWFHDIWGGRDSGKDHYFGMGTLLAMGALLPSPLDGG